MVEEVELHLFHWVEEEEERPHAVEVSDYEMEELVEAGQGFEEGCGPHEVEGVRVHHWELEGYPEIEDQLHLWEQ